MRCQNVENVSFGARLTTDRYTGKILKRYLEPGIIEFEKQTQNKKGCITLRQLDECDESPDAVYFFWNSKVAPRHYFGNFRTGYSQVAYTTKNFLKHLIVEKNPKEQANIFESIFDALQVIPKKLKRNEKTDEKFMADLSAKISEKLGENKELLEPMFEHITGNPNKKLKIEDINF